MVSWVRKRQNAMYAKKVNLSIKKIKTKQNKNKQTNKTNKHNTRQIAQSNRKATYLEC